MDVENTRVEVVSAYPGCRVKVAKIIAKWLVSVHGPAMAVIERSQAHFHMETQEVYGVLRGTLCVSHAELRDTFFKRTKPSR